MRTKSVECWVCRGQFDGCGKALVVTCLKNLRLFLNGLKTNENIIRVAGTTEGTEGSTMLPVGS